MPWFRSIVATATATAAARKKNEIFETQHQQDTQTKEKANAKEEKEKAKAKEKEKETTMSATTTTAGATKTNNGMRLQQLRDCLKEHSTDHDKCMKIIHRQFASACLCFDMEDAKQLLAEYFNTKPSMYDALRICIACENNNVHMVAHILEQGSNVGGIDVSAHDDELFWLACRQLWVRESTNDVAIPTMLLNYQPNINVSVKEDEPFCSACANGNMELIRLLLSVKPNIHIGAASDYAFKRACVMGRLDVVKWFHEMYPGKYKYEIIGDADKSRPLIRAHVMFYRTIHLT